MNVVRLRDSRDERFVEDVGIPYDPDEPSTASRIATYLTDTGYDDISTHGAILADVSSPEEQDDIIRGKILVVGGMLIICLISDFVWQNILNGSCQKHRY